jgi:hypothetical protein
MMQYLGYDHYEKEDQDIDMVSLYEPACLLEPAWQS